MSLPRVTIPVALLAIVGECSVHTIPGRLPTFGPCSYWKHIIDLRSVERTLRRGDDAKTHVLEVQDEDDRVGMMP